MSTLSRRELTLQAFKTQLATINVNPAGGGEVVYIGRNLDDEITLGKLPALIVVDGGHRKNPAEEGGEVTGRDIYVLRVSVCGYAKASTDEALGGAISDLNARIVKCMLVDTTLAGTADFMRESVDAMDDPTWDHVHGRNPNAAFYTHFDVIFTTAQGNPFATPGN